MFTKSKIERAGRLVLVLGVVSALYGSTSLSASTTLAQLPLGEVLTSVESHLPPIRAAYEELNRTDARVVSAQGAFDLQLSAAVTDINGFYDTEQLEVGIEQAIAPGGIDLIAGYRLGRGNFAPWDGGLETDTRGEYGLGFKIPLLRDRQFDKRRAARQDASLERQRAEFDVIVAQLELGGEAARAYWKWVARGEKLRVAQDLLQLALNRRDGLAESVDAGLLPRIALDDNERLIAERRAIELAAVRDLQQSAIKLSLFLRDDSGFPRIPTTEELPLLPTLDDPRATSLDAAVDVAATNRPEVRILDIERERLRVAGRAASNELLPEMDLAVKGSQDFGRPSSSTEDKGPFKLEAGVTFDLPVQRREARGKQAEVAAKTAQLDWKLQFAREKAAARLREADTALTQALAREAEASRSLELAARLEDAERFAMSEGDSDLLRLNLRETQTARARSTRIDVLLEALEAWTEYQVAFGERVSPSVIGSVVADPAQLD